MNSFNDGIRLVLQRNPALPAPRIRELGASFNAAQERVCAALAALGYPFGRMAAELKAGTIEYFREGGDRDQKGRTEKKASYRFAGIAPSHVAEFDLQEAGRAAGNIPEAEARAWMTRFLMRFTFEVIEQVALRARLFPAGSPEAGPARGELEAALAGARGVRDEILSGNLLLVAKIVVKRARWHRTMVMDDLFAAGTDGLMIAIGRYDPAIGHFSTYATPWITMAIDRFVAKTRHVIRIPIGLQDKVRRSRREAAAANTPGEPGFPLIPEVQSLEEPLPGFSDGELRLEDVVADTSGAGPHEAAEHSDISRILHGRFQRLDTLKQLIIAMRCDIGDAAALGARLFAEEMALSLARGRATAEAAFKSLDTPARVRMFGGPDEPEPAVDQPAGEVGLAVCES